MDVLLKYMNVVTDDCTSEYYTCSLGTVKCGEARKSGIFNWPFGENAPLAIAVPRRSGETS
jgi:hypothetical protein